MSKILVLGDGKLGSEIVKQSKWFYISRQKDDFDFRYIHSYAGYLKNYDTIINTIANTESYSPDRESMRDVNYKAVVDLADYCEATHKKLVHIGTDFSIANSEQPATEDVIPMPANNWYSYYKTLADEHILMRMNNCLVLRGSFKSNPFPYPNAFTNVEGNFLYVNEFAKLVIELTKKGATGLYNVGSKNPYTMYEFALKTNPGVNPICDWIDDSMPESVVMDTSKMW
ncbi:MAG: sugar nucleotide-binding protein, partial [Oligoflexia bacterium]|nr:sugar nucleotide-binding protein [Oligoflexia bacterium]